MTSQVRTLARALTLAGLLLALPGAAGAAVISLGAPTTTVPSHLSDGSYLFGITVTLGADQFLLPVLAADALALQTWQVDVSFDPTVVQVVDSGDGTSGFYGAPFVSGDASSMSFILSGLANNVAGLVDDLAGSYPDQLAGVTGNGVLAYILFEYAPDQRGKDPKFGLPAAVPVPEPGTVVLLGVALTGTALRRRLARRSH